MKTIPSLIALSLFLVVPLFADDAPCCAVKSAPAPAPAAGTIPGDSLYHLTATWHDQDGRSVTLADFAGEPVIITMIFTHCAYACPRIVVDLKAIRDALPAPSRDRVRFVLASFDTVRDTPERLHAWAAGQDLGANWTLLHGDVDAVRELSVALEIPFIPQADGGFGHGNRIVLLDAHGVPTAASEGLGAQPGPLVGAALNLTETP